MENSERSKKLALKLFVPLRFDVFAIQPDLLARIILTVLYFLVPGSVLQFLCMEKVLIANCYLLSQLFS